MEEHVQVCVVFDVSADITATYTIIVVIEVCDNYHSCYSDIIVNCKVSLGHVTFDDSC